MKKSLLFLGMMLAVVACSTTKLTPQEKAQQRAQEIQQVNKNIQNRHFSIDIDYMYPQQGPARRVDFGYFLAVHGDTLNSGLPYFGRAYQVPYGGGKALNFETKLSSYNAYRVKNGLMRVEIKAQNEEDQYYYTLDIYDNGKTDITVLARERDQIRFSGTMNLDKKK
ncbi:MAG: DUF4251 domain-containing protein [Prevotella sp.]|jgi:hypothetical protein|nr:DUF4251 domain-containing protein [Prevotella sp.]MCI1282701.1 DUF4251 domain-containing protein [Prevotella sp.]